MITRRTPIGDRDIGPPSSATSRAGTVRIHRSFLSRRNESHGVGIVVDVIATPLFYWRTPLIIVTSEQRLRWRMGTMIGVVVFVALVILAGLTDR